MLLDQLVLRDRLAEFKLEHLHRVDAILHFLRHLQHV